MLKYSELLIYIPTLIAIACFLFVFPLVQYVLARLFVKVWPKVALRVWAMSGVNLKKIPDYCSYPCDGRCRNWTCPNYSKKSTKEQVSEI